MCVCIVYVCLYVYVCVYVCVNVCVYLCACAWVCVGLCVHMCLGVHVFVCMCAQRPEKLIRMVGAGVTGICELLYLGGCFFLSPSLCTYFLSVVLCLEPSLGLMLL